MEKKHKRKENKGVHEIRVEAEDTKYKQIIPAVECSVSNLPDSDGTNFTSELTSVAVGLTFYTGVTNMWRLQHHDIRISTGLVYFFRSPYVYILRNIVTFLLHTIIL